MAFEHGLPFITRVGVLEAPSTRETESKTPETTILQNKAIECFSLEDFINQPPVKLGRIRVLDISRKPSDRRAVNFLTQQSYLCYNAF